MRVLIMGSNARTGSSRYTDRYVTFAGLICDAHRAAGDDVFIRNWEPGIQHEGWGRIYLGLASPAYVGADRIFGTLIAFAELRDGPNHDPRLRFFIDDPDLRVLRNAISSVANEPSKIFAPFNAKRQNFHLVVDDTKMRAKVVRGLELLVGDDMEWPTTYIPMFPWGDAKRLASPLRPHQRASVRGVDPTPFVVGAALQEAADISPVSSALIPRDAFWVAESPKHDPWTKSTHVQAPVLSAKIKSDAARISLYREALGVLEPQLASGGVGWWSSRMLMAALAKTYYATEWRGLREMEHNLPYIQALPAAYEELNELERSMLVYAQHEALLRSTRSAAEALEELNVTL